MAVQPAGWLAMSQVPKTGFKQKNILRAALIQIGRPFHLIKQIFMATIDNDPSKNKDPLTRDASETNKTDKNGAFVDKDGKSKNYKGGESTENGPNYDKKSEGADGDTSSTAGVFK